MDTVIEKREPPQWSVDRVALLGGLNQYGRPNFRVVWGGNRLHTVGGMFQHVAYVDGPVAGTKIGVVTQIPELRQQLAYHPFRWHLERYRDPSFYGTREEWYAQTWDEEAQLHRMGDYPAEGDYEHVFYLAQCPHVTEEKPEWCALCKASSGQYIDLEENFFLLEQQINWLKRSENVTPAEERAAMYEREDRKRRLRNQRVTEIVQNAMRPRLVTQPTSWQPGTNSRTSVPEPKIDPRVASPLGRASFQQSNFVLPGKKQKELDDAK